MAISLNSLKKLTKKQLANMVIDYQNKFKNMLSKHKRRTYFFKGQIYENGIPAFSYKESEQ